MTQKFVYSIFYGSLFTKSQNILLSRWLHPKLISTLKFLSNWKTMLWVIAQEQRNIKTQEFTETNSYFYSFTYEKNIFSSSSHRWVAFFMNLLADRFNTRIFSACWRYKLGFYFSLYIRYKWVNSIDWSTKLSLIM